MHLLSGMISVKVAYLLGDSHSTLSQGKLGPYLLTSSWVGCPVWAGFVRDVRKRDARPNGKEVYRYLRGDSGGRFMSSSGRGLLFFTRVAIAVGRFRTALPLLCDAAMGTMINDTKTAGWADGWQSFH